MQGDAAHSHQRYARKNLSCLVKQKDQSNSIQHCINFLHYLLALALSHDTIEPIRWASLVDNVSNFFILFFFWTKGQLPSLEADGKMRCGPATGFWENHIFPMCYEIMVIYYHYYYLFFFSSLIFNNFKVISNGLQVVFFFF